MACSWTALALATLISQMSYCTDIMPNLYHNFLTDRCYLNVRHVLQPAIRRVLIPTPLNALG
jgi:hypothetical protein